MDILKTVALAVFLCAVVAGGFWLSAPSRPADTAPYAEVDR
jgi:hypothetical protein